MSSHDFVPAGFHSFNGNGEMTGTIWLAEQGLLASPICITNTHAVGVVRDAIVHLAARRRIEMAWHLPVTAETWDGWLSDAEQFSGNHRADAIAALERRQRRAQCRKAMSAAAPAWFATSSRAAPARHRAGCRQDEGGWTVGALVQANYGLRNLLRCGHAPVGLEITDDGRRRAGAPHAARSSRRPTRARSSSSWRPMPRCCRSSANGWRDARPRASPGSAAIGSNSSGDIFLAFSTGNKVPMKSKMTDLRMLGMDECSPLFQAAAEATEEAIWNAMIAADTMTGWQGHTVNAIPHDLLQQAVRALRAAGLRRAAWLGVLR